MWMPIMVFFYMVFEHSVVNMFLFPSGLMLGGQFSIMDYLIWNEIPTVLGNLVGGLAFTGLTLYATHVRTAPKRASSSRRRLSVICRYVGPRPVRAEALSLGRSMSAQLAISLGQHSDKGRKEINQDFHGA